MILAVPVVCLDAEFDEVHDPYDVFVTSAMSCLPVVNRKTGRHQKIFISSTRKNIERKKALGKCLKELLSKSVSNRKVLVRSPRHVVGLSALWDSPSHCVSYGVSLSCPSLH